MSARLLKNCQAVLATVRGALLRRGRTQQEAEDLVQEAWIRLACYEDERAPVEQPEAFLMRTALNLSIDAYRTSAGRGEHTVLDDVVLIDTAPSIDDVLLAKERMARMVLGLARLNDKTREIFLAHRIDGLSTAELAKRHGLTLAGVQYHVATATMRLTAWMEGW